VVNHAGRILGDVDSLGRDLEGLGDRLVGRLRVGVFPTAAAVLAPRAIAHLASEHPGLSVQLSEASTPTLLGELRNGRLAVAVVAAGTGLPSYDLDGLAIRRIPAGDLCVAVWEGHRLATRTGSAPAVGVDELAGERWVIGVGDRDDPQFTAWPTLREPVIAHRARSWPSRLGLVAAGLGICVIPEIAAASAPEGVTTVRVDDPGWPGRVTLAVTRTEPTAEMRAVLDALESAGLGIRADLRGPD
jgi:DNA-binding transcriptional LysR family regulator